MALRCPTPVTGDQFLSGTLTYLDCAGQQIGWLGYQALAAPGSTAAIITLTAITLMISLLGVRMMFGHEVRFGDIVLGVVKIGIVLMLISSWPAVRTLVYQPLFDAPAQLQVEMGIDDRRPLVARLQSVDSGIIALTAWGTGRDDIRAGITANGDPAATAFAGIGLADKLALGVARAAYLTSIISSYGLVRFFSGLMIAALPLFAALMLFRGSRGLFLGWVRMAVGLIFAGLAVRVLLMLEVSLLEPWLETAIAQRDTNYATPSAPTELLAMASAFALLLVGSIMLIMRLCLSIDVSKQLSVVVSQVKQVLPSASPQTERAHRLQADTVTRFSQDRASHLAEQIRLNDRRAQAMSQSLERTSLATQTTRSPADPPWMGGSRSDARRRAMSRTSRSALQRDHR